MLSFPKVSNEIMVLAASFVSILHGKSEKLSTSSKNDQFVEKNGFRY
jgi:hypothetical protein